MISIKDVRKGARVQLQNGWFATVLDNKVNSQVRMCEVEGLCTEMGSVYSADIARVMKEDGSFYPVELTASQIKAAKMRSNFGF